jgi:cytochrome c peroxidase
LVDWVPATTAVLAKGSLPRWWRFSCSHAGNPEWTKVTALTSMRSRRPIQTVSQQATATIFTDRSAMQHSRIVWLLGAGLGIAGAVFAADPQGPRGENPHPIHLVRPSTAPLSAMARLGERIFYDTSLSSSGELACASCHSPQHAYGPPTAGPVMFGGPELSRQGARAVPSLTYLERQPGFSIGPEDPVAETVDLAQMDALGQKSTRERKTATQTARPAINIIPQGGQFWDGRADTLQAQATGPLLDPREMDGGSIAIVATKLRHAPYAKRFAELFGEAVLNQQPMLVSEAMFALARYQIEEPSFHPYTSKFDYWLEGKASLSEKRNARVQVIQRSGQSQLRRMPYFAASRRWIAASVYRSPV